MDLAYGLVKAEGEEICRKDKALCRLFVASCFHQWEELPGLPIKSLLISELYHLDETFICAV